MKKGKWWKILLALFVAVLLIAVGLFRGTWYQLDKIRREEYLPLDIASIPDGTYRGKASALLVEAEVEVTMAGGKIQQVAVLSHKHGPGYGAESMAEKMVSENTYSVDGVSGATGSSTVMRVAVYKALRSGGSR